MVPFGGWDMPLQYQGVLEEHRACRSRAVMFDVSHLGSVRVEGPGAFAALQQLLTNDLTKIGPGRAQYTHLLDDDGSVVDDIIVWWVAPDDFVVIPNASNTTPALDALHAAAAAAPGGAKVADVTAERALLAVQGPDARSLLFGVAPDAAGVAHFGVAPFSFAGVDCLVGGTGYTGEDGVELFVPAAAAVAVWRSLIAAGHPPRSAIATPRRRRPRADRKSVV